MKYANLHLHSYYSDCAFSPRQLICIAKALGYKALALTDHETHGGVPETIAIAKQEGLDAVSGAEFYANGLGHHFHITALDFDMNDPGINAHIKDRCDTYNEYTRKCFERALKLGYIGGVTWNEVLDYCFEGSWICVDQVFDFLKSKGILERGGDTTAMRQKMFKEPEARSFYPVHKSAEEVIKVIRNAGGVAVLAHPYHQTDCVPKLVEMGLNGIEVSHPDLYEDARLAMEAAKTYRLYRSGGTDHTGALSACGGKYAIPALHGATEEEYYTLKERRLG